MDRDIMKLIKQITDLQDEITIKMAQLKGLIVLSKNKEVDNS